MQKKVSFWSRTLLLLVAGLTLSEVAQLKAATRKAISASLSDVVAAIGLASDGDTVVVPSGTASWTSAITISKAITLQGSGTGQTIIQDNLPTNAPNPQSLLVFNTPANTNQSGVPNVRLTGFEFRAYPAGRTNNFGQGLIQLNRSSNAVRVDHCRFMAVKNRCLYITGSVFGVMDHCEIDNNNSIQGPIYFYHNGILGPNGEPGNFGDGSWAIPTNLGSANAFFVEDCTFGNTASINSALTDGNAGCRFVVRHCSIHNYNVHAHGTGSTGRSRSVRSSEVYMNTFSYDAGVTTNALFIRGGTGVCWGNKVTGPTGFSNALFIFENYRSNEYIWPVLANNKGDGSDGQSGFDVNDTADHTGNGYNGGPNGVWASGMAQARSSGSTLIISGPGLQNWKGYAVVNLDHTYTSNGNTYNTFATVQSNSGNTLTVGVAPHSYAAQTWTAGDRYVIRKCNFSLDTIGAGQGDYLGGGTNPSPRWLNQASEPYYLWDNTFNGSHTGFAQGHGGGEINSAQTNFVDNGTTPKPGYTPYTYPHSLVSGQPMPTLPGLPPPATGKPPTTTTPGFAHGFRIKKKQNAETAKSKKIPGRPD